MRYTEVIPENVLSKMSPEDRAKLGKAGRTFEECEASRESIAEKDLQRLIWNYLLGKGIQPFRQRMDKKTTGVLGQPDILFAYRGMPIAFEVKTQTGQLSKEQREMEEKLQSDNNGWFYYVIRSMDEAKQVMEQLRTMPV